MAKESISKKRLYRLAAIYGPFVRFFPEGSEGSEGDGNTDLTDQEAAQAAIKESEELSDEQVKTSPQFKGILRDKQSAETRAQNAEAQSAAYKVEIERRNQANAQQQKPAEPELSEEELNVEITRGELIKSNKNLADSISENLLKHLDDRDAKNKNSNIQKSQATDATDLMKTHTEKTKGLGLDAKTVVDETIVYLRTNEPDMLEALIKTKDYASKLYKYGVANVPSIAEKAQIRRNTLLAEKMDQKGDDVPGGSKTSMEAFSEFEALMTAGAEETIYSG